MIAAWQAALVTSRLLSSLTSETAEGALLAHEFSRSLMIDDLDPQVRMQLAYSLGEWSDPRASQALGQLAHHRMRTALTLLGMVFGVGAVIAMLAVSALGATWASCSPDFGADGILDRFGQIRPRLLFTADGYRYGGKSIDSLAASGEKSHKRAAPEAGTRNTSQTRGAEAAALKAELIAKLNGLVDEEKGEVGITEVFDTSKLYRGPYLENAPELIIGYNADSSVNLYLNGIALVTPGSVTELNLDMSGSSPALTIGTTGIEFETGTDSGTIGAGTEPAPARIGASVGPGPCRGQRPGDRPRRAADPG